MSRQLPAARRGHFSIKVRSRPARRSTPSGKVSFFGGRLDYHLVCQLDQLDAAAVVLAIGYWQAFLLHNFGQVLPIP